MGSTNDFSRFPLPDNLTQDWLIPNAGGTAKAVGIGDLMYDGGSQIAYPADVQADQGSLALNQIKFASLFIGVSQEQILLAETSTTKKFVIRTAGVVDFACASATYNPGDLLGPNAGAGPPYLDPQTLVKVNSLALAVAVVIPSKYAGVANQTRIRAMMISRRTNDPFNPANSLGGQQGISATTLADGAATITVDSNPILNMVPTAARNVTLPKESASKGLEFQFTNNSAGANTVTFKASDGATAIKGNGACPQNKTILLWCDGTNWNGLVSA